MASVQATPVPLLHIAILALVQGITEFLPISSSGHLILLPAIGGWSDQGLVIDIAVHVGTLGAVVLYFRNDVGRAVMGAIDLVRRRDTADRRLAINLVVATVPVVVFGYAATRAGVTAYWRSVEVIAWTTLIFGIALFVADRVGMTIRRIEHMRPTGALALGLAQVLALVPGTSRAGIVVMAARALGYERGEAARFSMLLSIPTISAAGTLGALEIWASGDIRLGVDAALAAALAFASALMAIAVLMFWLRRQNFTPFVVYRLVLGAALLYWVYA